MFSINTACIGLACLVFGQQSFGFSISEQTKFLYHDLARQWVSAQGHNKVTAIVELERPGAEIFEDTGVAVKHVYPGGRIFDVEADLEKLERFSL
ncbi:MAG: hypothetical protein ACR2QW_00750, partial [bacterium]